MKVSYKGQEGLWSYGGIGLIIALMYIVAKIYIFWIIFEVRRGWENGDLKELS